MAIDREAIAAAYGRGGSLTTDILAEPSYYTSPTNKYEHKPAKSDGTFG